ICAANFDPPTGGGLEGSLSSGRPLTLPTYAASPLRRAFEAGKGPPDLFQGASHPSPRRGEGKARSVCGLRELAGGGEVVVLEGELADAFSRGGIDAVRDGGGDDRRCRFAEAADGGAAFDEVD